MAFGVKLKNIATEKAYTVEEFFEAIKGKSFTAGEPSLTKHGPSTIITFPPLDRQNQVWITRSSMSASSKKWCIQKGEQAGVGNMLGNMAADKLTGGLFGFGSVVGSNVKKCEKLVDVTVEELKALNL